MTMPRTLEPLMDVVLGCQKTCNNCFEACLKEEDASHMAECLRKTRECADMCGIVLDYAQRNSEILPELLEACAKSCELCAEECEKHDHDHCQSCAKASRACAKACRSYIA